MPLLKRKPFTPEKPPPDLKPSEKVFVCRHTNEVFTDYESFFKRTILCNSLVWSCKFTGKSTLTYSEALESEEEVIKQANSLSSPLQRAALTLVHHIQRGRLANLCDEVFSYLKDRYQEGEDVEVQHSSKRRKGKIKKVIEPDELSNGFENKPESSKSRKSSTSSGRDKKVEKSTSTPGKIRKGSDTSAKSRKSSEGSSKTPEKVKSVEEIHETPEKSKKNSSSSLPPKSPKKLLSPKSKKSSKNDTEILSSPKSKSSSSNELGNTDDVIIVEDYNLGSESKNEQNSESPGKSPKANNAGFWPDPKKYKYAVQLYPDKSSKKKETKDVIIVDFDHVCRKKGSFTRDKLKNFLKLSCERTSQNAEGFYFVKVEYRKKFDLGEVLFEIPMQLDSPPKNKSRKRKSSQDDGGETSSGKKKKAKADGRLSKEDVTEKRKKTTPTQAKKFTPEERLRIIEEEREKRRKIMEEDKEKRRIQKEQERVEREKRKEEEKEKKKIERDQLKEQKRHEALLLKEWNRPREDLELDDLKDLPEPVPVQVRIANELFGDAVMVVEFLYVFGSLFDIKDEFPSPLNFSMLEDALAETDPEGVYYDLLQFLLGAILRTHMDEEEDEGLESADSQTPLDLDDEDYHTAKVSASAAMAAVWPMLHQGKPLHELIMDPFTCTELLRLHLLSSGARIGCGDSEYRWHSRGGFTYADDAGVEFRHREPRIMKTLVTGSVYDLSAEEKLKILNALCGQLMTYATSREYIEDGFDKLKKTRREWLSDQWAEQRRGKEEAAARYRKRQEERMKQKEELEKKKKEKENEKSQDDKKQPENSGQDEAKQSEGHSGIEGKKDTEARKDTKGKENKETKKDKEDKEEKKDTKGKENKETKKDKEDKEEKKDTKGKKDKETKKDKEDKEERKDTKGKKDKETKKDKEEKKDTKGKKDKETKKDKGKKRGNKELEKESNDREKKDENKPDENTEVDDKKKQEEVLLTKEEEEQLALEKKLDRERREQDYLQVLRKAVSMSSVQPLGRDRIYRRYWTFRSLKGLFVEDDDPDLPRFLDTIFEEEICEDDDEQDSINGETDDKNDNTEKSEQSQTNSEETNDSQKSTVPSVQKAKDSPQSQLNQLKKAEVIGKYGKRDGITRWSYLGGQQDLECLLSALNPRGQRERVLRDALQSDYRYLSKAIEKCPLREENEVAKKIPKTKTRKQQQNVDKSRYKTTEEFLEANLRDQILDIEDRLWQGGLAAIKVEDRASWRTKLEDGIYSHMSENKDNIKKEDVTVKNENGEVEPVDDVDMKSDSCLVNGDSITESPKHMETENTMVEDNITHVKAELREDGDVVTNGDAKDDHDDTEPELMKVEEQSSVPGHLKLDLDNSRSTFSPNESRTGTPVISLAPTSMPINPAVKELALALLKVEQGIESKYLSPPLGEDEETKRQKQKDAAALALAEFNEMMKSAEEGKDSKKKKTKNAEKQDDDEQPNKEKDGDETKDENDDDNSSTSSTQENPSKQKTCLERWEESLMACSSLAQVFVHLNTLDGSVTWSKSVLNARCRLCRRKGDGEKMLLCDACDRGHHMYCLKPPIKQVPEGNWFCPDCRPKEPRRSGRRRRAHVSDDEEEDEQEEEDSEEEEDSDEESETEEESEAAEASDANSEHVDVCALCEQDGELLCCDVCPLAYHVDCAYPPLRRIPRGNWACQVCTGADDERPKKCRVKKSTIKAALRNAKELEKQKSGKKSKPSKPKSKKRSTSPVQPKSRGRKESTDSAPQASKRRKVRDSSPSSSVSSTPVSTRRKRNIPSFLRINGRSSVDSSRSPSPVRKVATKRDPRLAGRLLKCGKLLDEVMQHMDADFFSDTVNLAKYPNYNHNPIDLSTIKNNIKQNAYNTVEDFISDVRKVFIDCAEHFRPRAKEARAGIRLSAHFETRLSEMGLDMSQRSVRSCRKT